MIRDHLTDRVELWPDPETKLWGIQKQFYQGKLINEDFVFRCELDLDDEFQEGDIVDMTDGTETGLVVTGYEEDACGDGCCQAVYVKKGLSNKFCFWPSQVRLNLKANGIEEV